jgi:diguanylate cyclase (GGDEF)-like protein
VIYPFYIKLRDAEQQRLLFSRNTSEIIVNDYIYQIKSVAEELSNKSNSMVVLRSYRSGKVSQKTLQEIGALTIHKWLDSSINIVGFVKKDIKGKILLKVGKTAFFENEKFELRDNHLTVSTPKKWGDHYFINVSCPIYDENSTVIGVDVLAFDITALQSSIYKKLQYHKGDILISSVDGDKATLFSPLKSKWNSYMLDSNILSSTVIDAAKSNNEGVASGKLGGSTVYIAYASLDEPSWVLSIIIKKDMLFSDLEVTTYLIILFIIAIIVLFTFGINHLLKPLSGRIIMHNHDLDEKIKSSQEGLRLANKKLRMLVNHDSLTGAYNRRGFALEFKKIKSKAKRDSCEFSLFFIDVNKFKLINDTYGHDVGDAVLLNIADRLKVSMREEDVIARIGGDEFVVISPGISKSESITVYNKILSIGQMPIIFEQKPISYHVSIGSATYPVHGKTLQDLLSHADDEMYKKKRI